VRATRAAAIIHAVTKRWTIAAVAISWLADSRFPGMPRITANATAWFVAALAIRRGLDTIKSVE
jgi:hypothetical protein